jgi:hypothetical protein
LSSILRHLQVQNVEAAMQWGLTWEVCTTSKAAVSVNLCR